MTKVQAQFDLAAPLDDKLMDRIARSHGVYGLHRIVVAPTLDSITVEYDASHLMASDVESTLARAGIPVRRKPAPTTTAQAAPEPA